MVPIEISSQHSYSTSIHTIDLSCTVWPQYATRQTTDLLSHRQPKNCMSLANFANENRSLNGRQVLLVKIPGCRILCVCHDSSSQHFKIEWRQYDTVQPFRILCICSSSLSDRGVTVDSIGKWDSSASYCVSHIATNWWAFLFIHRTVFSSQVNCFHYFTLKASSQSGLRPIFAFTSVSVLTLNWQLWREPPPQNSHGGDYDARRFCFFFL